MDRITVLREVTLLRRQLRESRGFGALLATSPAVQEVYRFIELASASSAPVLISGETGTGKELVARTIHEMSARGKGPFVAVNCSNEKYERQVKPVDDAALTRLREHGWPGNVRSPAPTMPATTEAVVLPLGTTSEQGERELIQRTLESVKSNKTRAAAILGTTPRTLHKKARRGRCEAAATAGS